MNYENAEIHLSINLQGGIASRGNYEFKQSGYSWEKVDGKMEKTPIGTLKTTVLPKNHECFKSTTLRSQFVNWAISDDARPKREMSAKYWKNLSAKNRLKFHINKYVESTHGDVEFSFEIIN